MQSENLREIASAWCAGSDKGTAESRSGRNGMKNQLQVKRLTRFSPINPILTEIHRGKLSLISFRHAVFRLLLLILLCLLEESEQPLRAGAREELVPSESPFRRLNIRRPSREEALIAFASACASSKPLSDFCSRLLTTPELASG